MNFDYERIETLDLFKNFSREEIIVAIDSLGGQIKSFKDGEEVYIKNRKINQIGIVIKGRVALKQVQINGIEVILTYFGEYKVFGSVACFLNSEIENVEFIAKGNAEILFLNISESTLQNNDFKLRLLENLTVILAKISFHFFNRTTIISQPNLRGKILLFFNNFYKQTHKNPFELPLTRNEMANYINADRSALCRELSRMQNEGYFKIEGRQITLLRNSLGNL